MRKHIARAPLSFGAHLKRLRRGANLSQDDLAKLTNYTAGYISKLERGVRPPTPASIGQLAHALGLSAAEREMLDLAASETAGLANTPPAVSWPPVRAALATPWPSPRSADADAAPFVGRHDELERIEALLAGEGRPALLVAGEPGMGKSHLLRLAAERGVSLGWTVLAGASLRHDWEDPFAPLVGMLERLIRLAPDEARPALLAGCTGLVWLLPELSDVIEPSMSATKVAIRRAASVRRQIHDAVARLLRNNAGPVGTLLLLDDLHWAGAEAFDLLGALLRLPAERPVRLLGAYRPTEQPGVEHFTSFVADVASAGLAELTTLRPLSAQESARLLSALLPRAPAEETQLRDDVVRRAGGVPFFLISCARTLRGATETRESVGGSVTWEVAQTVRQRLAVLPESAQVVVRATALANPLASAALLLWLARRLEQSEAATLRGIEAACRAGLLVECGGHYTLPYPLLGEVIVGDLGAAQRIRLHALLAEGMVAVEPEPPARALADHYRQANDPERFEFSLRRAGAEANARAAYREAAQCYGELADWLAARDRALDAAAARFEQTHALYHLNEYARCLDALEEVARAYERAEGQHEALARVATAMGWAYAAMGMPRQGIERIMRALRQPVDYRIRTRAGLFMSLANLYQVAGQYGFQLAAANRAVELAQIVPDSALIAKALASGAQALHMLNFTDEGLRSFEHQIMELAQDADDHWTLAHVCNSVANVYLMRGEFERSREFADRALATARLAHDTALVAFMVLRRGSLAYYRGTWPSAHRLIQQGLTLLRPIKSVHTAFGHIALGRLLLAEGQWEQAREQIAQGLDQAQHSGDPQVKRLGHGALAERELLLGDPAAALERLTDLDDRNKAQEEADATEVLPLLCWAYLDLGDIKEATEQLDKTIHRARLTHMHCALVDALRVRALLLAREQRWGEATNALQEGLAHTRHLGYPYGHAKLLYTHGVVLSAQGTAPCASQQFEAALVILNRLGERLYAERVEHELARLTPPC